MSEKSTAVTWTIGFGTERLAQEYARNGIDRTFDGVTHHSIEVTDVLDPGMSLPDAPGWALVRRNSALEPNQRTARVTLDTGAEGSTTTDLGEFSIEVRPGQGSDSGQSARIVLTGPFAPQANYQILYSAPVTSATGKATAGFVYENYATLDGTSWELTGTKSFLDSFSLTVNLELGYGTFSVDKYVSGPAAHEAPGGSRFPVRVDYALPAGTTRADYPAWDPPGTLNGDQASGSAAFEAVMGSKTVFTGPTPPVTFPAGTTITLSEPAPSVPLPSGHTWGEGAFKVNGRESTTLTIEDQRTMGVELANTIEAAPSTFEIVKTTTGALGAVTRDYTVTYTCSDGAEGILPPPGHRPRRLQPRDR